MMRPDTYLARALWSLSVALLLVGCVLIMVNLGALGPGYTVSVLALGLPAFAMGTVGLLIAARRPDNAIGWIYLGCGLWIALGFANAGYIGWATVVSPGGFGLGFVGFVDTEDEAPILFTLLAAAITAVICFTTRFRRSSGVERQQLKWMAFAVPAMVAGWVTAGAVEEWNLLADALRVVAMATVPTAAGLAITRFRLYDVDRVISRTTAYALVTGGLLGVYVTIVTALTSLAPTSGPTGEPDVWLGDGVA